MKGKSFFWRTHLTFDSVHMVFMKLILTWNHWGKTFCYNYQKAILIDVFFLLRTLAISNISLCGGLEMFFDILRCCCSFSKRDQSKLPSNHWITQDSYESYCCAARQWQFIHRKPWQNNENKEMYDILSRLMSILKVQLTVQKSCHPCSEASWHSNQHQKHFVQNIWMHGTTLMSNYTWFLKPLRVVSAINITL